MQTAPRKESAFDGFDEPDQGLAMKQMPGGGVTIRKLDSLSTDKGTFCLPRARVCAPWSNSAQQPHSAHVRSTRYHTHPAFRMIHQFHGHPPTHPSIHPPTRHPPAHLGHSKRHPDPNPHMRPKLAPTPTHAGAHTPMHPAHQTTRPDPPTYPPCTAHQHSPSDAHIIKPTHTNLSHALHGLQVSLPKSWRKLVGRSTSTEQISGFNGLRRVAMLTGES